jgi:acetyl-CoA acetyltransferase
MLLTFASAEREALMAATLSDLRAVYVVGCGWHRYQYESQTPYVELGLCAIRAALADARIDWALVDEAFIGTALLGMASGRHILKHMGATGLPLVHIENASASGSAAFRTACINVAAGISETALVLGVDKRINVSRASGGLPSLADDAIVPFTHFALLANAYASRHGVKTEDIARVAVKNHANGALNPNAQRQQARTLEEVIAGRAIAGGLTALQCCPVGEGAAAIIVASEEGIRRAGVDPSRAIRVLSSAAASEAPGSSDAALTGTTIARALREAKMAPSEIDLLEVHDAFTIEELLYAEAAGICGEGEAVHLLAEGAFNLGGQCAISTSGGLIAMGHPIGPTGVGQIGEIALQLRGDAGPRQHRGQKGVPRRGVAHMVGLGSVCYAHVLAGPE